MKDNKHNKEKICTMSAGSGASEQINQHDLREQNSRRPASFDYSRLTESPRDFERNSMRATAEQQVIFVLRWACPCDAIGIQAYISVSRKSVTCAVCLAHRPHLLLFIRLSLCAAYKLLLFDKRQCICEHPLHVYMLLRPY